MHFEISPSTSPSTPISIGFQTGSPVNTYQSSPSSQALSCAFPSWPTGSSLGRSSLGGFGSSAPSSFISDLDLIPDDLLDELDTSIPLLDAPPPPPREYLAVAAPLLPLYASKPKQRRRSSRKERRPSKPMSPINESPETPE
ncbi:hypothetical protein W97_06660 [Coniosporium apollinis CBS 100218]|uniref:Uncharacterized protein n=1 Tax=Coniosporium apollinis (strain CBS 100218) TaxID=1168221 RepID=R7YZS4_CONA1|nr:uncharacterized protein W97_06660 [Coniosporium apollinis CBS 100218]EON67407.1 hypothetical protein W97_06660 [Coniosporium apollinis CBS 100218]